MQGTAGQDQINDACRRKIRNHYGAAPGTGPQTIPGFWDLVARCVANGGRFVPTAVNTQNFQQKALPPRQIPPAAVQAPTAPASPLSTGNQKNSKEIRVGNIESVLDQIILPTSERRDDWVLRVPAIPVQQQQFCRIVDRFHDEIVKVYLARNELRQNALYRERQADISALLPKGRFENWIVRVVEVRQAADGSGAILFQPPCRVMFGSDICGPENKKIYGTIAPNTPLYRELEKVSSGDFIVVSGSLYYANLGQAKSEAGITTRTVYPAGSYCSSNNAGKEQDVFVTEIDYLVQLR